MNWSRLQRIALVVLILLVVWLAAQSLAVGQRNSQLLRENTRLEGEVKALTREVHQLYDIATQTNEQLKTLGGTPVPIPPLPETTTTTTTESRRAATTAQTTKRGTTTTTARPIATTAATPVSTTSTGTPCPTPTVPVVGCPGARSRGRP